MVILSKMEVLYLSETIRSGEAELLLDVYHNSRFRRIKTGTTLLK